MKGFNSTINGAKKRESFLNGLDIKSSTKPVFHSIFNNIYFKTSPPYIHAFLYIFSDNQLQ